MGKQQHYIISSKSRKLKLSLVITWLNYDIPILYDEIIELIRSSHGELNFNDSLIAISCRIRKISFLASFDKDFDKIDWLKRISTPGDFGPEIHQD